MTRIKKSSKIAVFSIKHEEILACEDNRLKPFIEVFFQEPENIDQKRLGCLMGIFLMKDTGDQSSYLVNLLSSVLKKEYYKNYHRGAIDSFESALRKVNSALAEISRQGIIDWVGNLESVVGIFENNNFHFSSAGDIKVLLLRDGMLNDMTEFEDNGEQVHPLKTFIDVSSGRIQVTDKIILATDNIISVLSREQIKKNASRFPREKFSRFLRTALTNELEGCAAIILDFESPLDSLEQISQKSKKTEEELNAFGGKSFVKKEKDLIPQSTLESEIKTEFVDKKTGHIYIKGDEQEAPLQMENIYQRSAGKWQEKLYALLGKLTPLAKKMAKKSAKSIKILSVKIYRGSVKISRNSWRKFREYLEEKRKIRAQEAAEKPAQMERPDYPPDSTATEYTKTESIPVAENRLGAFKERLLPRFTRMKSSFSGLERNQKIYAFAIIAAIIIVPWIILKAAKNKNETAKNTAPVVQENRPLLDDKNVVWLENLDEINNLSDGLALYNLRDEIWAVSKNTIFRLSQSDKAYNLPEEFGTISLAVPMEDLSTIFIHTSNGKVVSFNTLSGKFSENSIDISNKKLDALGTYLTYLYVLDKSANQIYRYPRAEGGFGEGKNWVKETADFSQASDMTIGESIWLANNGKVDKLFLGKKENFPIEETATPIVAQKLKLSRSGENLFILDQQNSRIVKINLDGTINQQYYHEYLKDAKSFEITENSLTVLLNDGRIIQFGI